jgi:two-component system LytT family response regulator
MSPPFKTLIVDDEPLARRRVRRLLAECDEVEVVGEVGDGRAAVTAIDELRPDLVFLDVQMPDLDGFGVLAEVAAAAMPVVVFVTAYNEHALAAFEVSALDYVLKPFEKKRFEKALERALERLREKRSGLLQEQLAGLLKATQVEPAAAPAKTLKRLAVRRGERVSFVTLTEVDWLEADGPYVRLHVGKSSHLVRDSLKRLEKALDPAEFARVHRSAMVRIDRVEELRSLDHGEYEIALRGGARLKLSRSYRDVLERLTEG